MTEPNEKPWRRQKRWWTLTAALLAIVILDLVAAFALPSHYADQIHITNSADRLKAEGDLRSSILGLLTPVVALIAGVAALLNFQEARYQNQRTLQTALRQLELAHDQFRETHERNREQVELQRRGQITDRFSKAIEQLGSEKLDVQIGAVYGLEQIARDSQDLNWPVMQIVTAYLRERSAEPVQSADGHDAVKSGGGREEATRSSARAGAVADVIRRRRWEWDPVVNVDEDNRVWREPLNLEGCDLRQANLREAHLEGANFQGARLQLANFEGAQLHGAIFGLAQLMEAIFVRAELQGGYFEQAQLQGAYFGEADARAAYFGRAQLQGAHFEAALLHEAYFWEAELQKAYFGRAQLHGAHFERSDLRHADGLSQEQLDSAVCDETTKPPSGLTIKVKS